LDDPHGGLDLHHPVLLLLDRLVPDQRLVNGAVAHCKHDRGDEQRHQQLDQREAPAPQWVSPPRPPLLESLPPRPPPKSSPPPSPESPPPRPPEGGGAAGAGAPMDGLVGVWPGQREPAGQGCC